MRQTNKSKENAVSHLIMVMVVITLLGVVDQIKPKLCLLFQSIFLQKLTISLKRFKRSWGTKSPKSQL